MARPLAETEAAHENARWCVHELRIRRWRITVIAERLGVTPQTVHTWKTGKRAPRSERDMQRLISLTRAAMQFPPYYERVQGMMIVVEEVRAVLRLSYRGLARRLRLNPTSCGNWRFFCTQPGRKATVRLRALVPQLASLPEAERESLLRICNHRLVELRKLSKVRKARLRRLNEIRYNRDQVRKLRRSSELYRPAPVWTDSAVAIYRTREKA